MNPARWFARSVERAYLAFATGAMLWILAFSSLLDPLHLVSGIIMTCAAGLGAIFFVIWVEALEARAGRRFDGG